MAPALLATACNDMGVIRTSCSVCGGSVDPLAGGLTIGMIARVAQSRRCSRPLMPYGRANDEMPMEG